MGEGFGEDEEVVEEDDEVAEEGDPEDAEDTAGDLGNEGCEEGTEGDTAEERAADVAKGHAARGGRCDIRAVRVRHGHCGGERTAEAVEDGAKEDPLVVHGVRVGGGEDSNDLGAKTADDSEGEEVLAPVAVGERADFGADGCAQDAGEEGHVERELGRQGLHFGDPTLRVVGEHDDGGVLRIGVQRRLRRDVAPTDQREDEVEFRDNDATEGEGVDGKGWDEPPDLSRVNGRGRVHGWDY